ncbi:MAG: DUF4230 domain-containing protein [Spirochaetota bacterium]
MWSWIITFFSTRRPVKSVAIALAVLCVACAGYVFYIVAVKEAVLKNPHLIIAKVKTIAQYITHRYYDECVVDYTKDGDSKPTFVLVGRGTVYAGFDLQKLDKDPESIVLRGNTLTVRLPEPEIINTVIPPSGFVNFHYGRISEERYTGLKNRAIEKLRLRALEKDMLKLCRERGKVMIESFFETVGFDHVSVEFAGAQTPGTEPGENRIGRGGSR